MDDTNGPNIIHTDLLIRALRVEGELILDDELRERIRARAVSLATSPHALTIPLAEAQAWKDVAQEVFGGTGFVVDEAEAL